MGMAEEGEFFAHMGREKTKTSSQCSLPGMSPHYSHTFSILENNNNNNNACISRRLEPSVTDN